LDRETESLRAAARPTTEATLLARARAGDRDAFDRLAVGAVPMLLGTARRLLREAADAEEAVAEALVRAYERLRDFREQSAFSTWTHRILCRVAADRFRREARDARLRRALAERGPAAAEDAGALRGLAAAEERARVRAAVEELPPTQRLVLVLSAWEGLPHEEIARVLSMRYATVKSNLHHAREALRARLGSGDLP
jgi:RNA polymerase sigma-70 factor (ECF subfamily)